MQLKIKSVHAVALFDFIFFMTPFNLDYFVEKLLFKSSLSRMVEENSPERILRQNVESGKMR